ncbi:MAG: hypothetical protein AABO41_08130 [Acidobacteriota bacterium]
MDEANLSDRIDNILQAFRDRLREEGPCATKTQEQQELVAQLINALPYLERLKGARVNVGQAEVAAAALLAQEPQIELAKKIIEELARRIKIYQSTFQSVLHGRSPVSQLLLGIVVHLLLLAAILLGLAILRRGGILEGFEPITVWVLVGGALGGITSLLVRLHDFAIIARWSAEADPKVLFFTGMLKPVVGTVLALFIWSAFSSGLLSLNLQIAATNSTLLYFALSFLAGFSERFAPDLANRASPMAG